MAPASDRIRGPGTTFIESGLTTIAQNGLYIREPLIFRGAHEINVGVLSFCSDRDNEDFTLTPKFLGVL